MIGAPLAPMAVIAGAGSGKSETMAARLVWLVANQLVRPERVLGLTFTRKAAAELGERVRTRLDGLRRAGLPLSRLWPADDELLAGEPVISTYHAYAGRLVADHALREGLEPTLRLITPAVSLAARRAGGRRLRRPDGRAGVDTRHRHRGGARPRRRDGRAPARAAADVLAVGRWLEECLAGQTGRVPKAVTGRAQDPADQGAAAAAGGRVLRGQGGQGGHRLRRPDGPRRPDRGPAPGGRRRPSALVTRWCCLTSTRTPRTRSSSCCRSLFSGGHPVTAVGDPCQSIYGWRGASAGNLRRFSADFPEADGQPAPVRVLSTSFRNTGSVLMAAGAIQADLRGSGSRRAAAGGTARPGRARAGAMRAAGVRAGRGRVGGRAGRRPAAISRPAWLLTAGRGRIGGMAKVRPSDIAVLCRKRAQFAVLRAALEARGVPVEVVGLGGLLTVPEVADIVATLQVITTRRPRAPLRGC